MPVLSVGIHKGGVGKTTLAVALARYAAEAGTRTLLVDFDPQGNAGENFSDVDSDAALRTSCLLLADGLPDSPQNVAENLDLIPADEELLQAELLGLDVVPTLKTHIAALTEAYDLIVCDTPASLGAGMLAPLIVSDYCVSPMVPDHYGIGGIERFLQRVELIQEQHNPKLQYLGILVNLYRFQDKGHQEVLRDLRRSAPELLIPWQLNAYSAISNAQHLQQAVWRTAKTSSQRKAAAAMRDAVDWIYARVTAQNAADGSFAFAKKAAQSRRHP